MEVIRNITLMQALCIKATAFQATALCLIINSIKSSAVRYELNKHHACVLVFNSPPSLVACILTYQN